MNTHRQVEDEILNILGDTSGKSRSLARRLLINTEQQIISMDELQGLNQDIATDTTVAEQANYDLPTDFQSLTNVAITVGTTRYSIPIFEDWNKYLAATEITATSDIPDLAFIRDDEIYFYPTPSSASNTITFWYRKKTSDVQDLTGTTTSAVTNKLVDTAGAFTTANALNRTVVNLSDTGSQRTATVTAVDDANTLTLSADILASGDSYAVTNESLIPDEHIYCLVWRPLYMLYGRREDTAQMKAYKNEYDTDLDKLKRDAGALTARVQVPRTVVIRDPFYPTQTLTAS